MIQYRHDNGMIGKHLPIISPCPRTMSFDASARAEIRSGAREERERQREINRAGSLQMPVACMIDCCALI
jgi:hypothetical protein